VLTVTVPNGPEMLLSVEPVPRPVAGGALMARKGTLSSSGVTKAAPAPGEATGSEVRTRLGPAGSLLGAMDPSGEGGCDSKAEVGSTGAIVVPVGAGEGVAGLGDGVFDGGIPGSGEIDGTAEVVTGAITKELGRFCDSAVCEIVTSTRPTVAEAIRHADRKPPVVHGLIASTSSHSAYAFKWRDLSGMNWHLSQMPIRC
jgi:hypothetical protein